jgi:hypothetical protein
VCLVERFSRETSIDLFLLLLRLEYSTPWRIKSVRSFVRGRHKKKKKNVINEDEKKKKKMVANMSLAFGLKKPFGPCGVGEMMERGRNSFFLPLSLSVASVTLCNQEQKPS